MSSQKTSSYIPPLSHCKYDVFLSFRGEDTRTSFTDHLYSTLKQKGIFVYRDDNELERGKSISTLFKTIEESRFSIIVFSKTYAHSTWCLDELVKIIECKNTSDQHIIFPIFYNVEPTMVRKQIGSFQEAFAKHEEAFGEDIERVKKWRDALKDVANIAGWELKNKSESEIIEDIVKKISTNLISLKFETHYKELGGINSRVEELMLLLGKGSDDVQMIGIHGMGGLGKTTVARVVYDLISWEFEGSSFLANVRETCEKSSVVTLQNQLIYELLKLENSNIWNVHCGINMIGSSRIIITSRDEHLLMTERVDEVYKLNGLNDEEALQLFCIKAFKAYQPMKEYEQLSQRVLKYAAGLPLALKVLGSFLYARTIEEWKSALQRLTKTSINQIMKILQISFDGLQETEKKIFLDIACFFKGENRDYITKILDGCDFDPIIGISVLIEKSLIFILDYNQVWMHDLLQEMGLQIVKRECEKPGKRSRLWDEVDVHHVLSENTGSEVIEGIMLDNLEDEASTSADAKTFSKMTNLRLLKIHNVQLPKGLEYLPNELRLLEWRGYPLESLPSNLQLDNTIKLSMCYSNIKQMLNTTKPLNNMKFMRFSHSQNLIKTPDFTGLPNLEYMNLKGCSRLCEIHPSLLLHSCSKLRSFPEIEGRMECLLELHLDGTAIQELPLSITLLYGLVLLNLKDCKDLESLPSAIIDGLKHLKTLNLSGCSKLENVPENLGKVESLEELDISGTAIRQPPASIFLLRNLKALSFRGCKEAATSKSWFSRFSINLMPRRSSDSMTLVLPSLSGLSSLKKLDLSDCNLKEGTIINDIWNLFSLKELNLSRNNFVSLPGAINRLSQLQDLVLEDCKRLESLPELPSSVYKVIVDGCSSLDIVPHAFQSCKSRWLFVDSLNCMKSVDNNDLAFSMLKGLLEGESNRINRLSVVFPGSKLPEWLRFQNKGSSITIIRPLDSYNKNKNNLAGYAICCVFHVHKHPSTVKSHPSSGTHKLICQIKVDKRHYCGLTFDFDEQLGQPVSNHLWLQYLSTQELQRFSLWNHEFNHVEISFAAKRGPGLEVKSCGVHPVYVDEVEEFNSTTKEWRRSKVWKLNESDGQVFVGSTMDHVATTSKRTLTDLAEADASASQEEPKPKRFKALE
ncbi:TMV resistance protein N-like [Melia azedarach]|uniref:TMV resistance protein N-like n=1 Tax=Melia azedarach TaxID=155640 RepID=A0ACC1XT23_MELAZ|nr:TMV resistance protein N-like [Melia azedarach]